MAIQVQTFALEKNQCLSAEHTWPSCAGRELLCVCCCLNACCLHKCCKRIRGRGELPSLEVKLWSVLPGCITAPEWEKAGRQQQCILEGQEVCWWQTPRQGGQCQARRSSSLLHPAPELCLSIGVFTQGRTLCKRVASSGSA